MGRKESNQTNKQTVLAVGDGFLVILIASLQFKSWSLITPRKRDLRISTPSCACEPVPEVETDMADSGAQSGSVSDSALVMLSMGLFPSIKKQY